MLRRPILAILASCILCLMAGEAHSAVGVVVRLVSTGGAVDGEITATVMA